MAAKKILVVDDEINVGASLKMVLEHAGWNVSAAARALGIERTHLHKRIRALGLNSERR